MKDNSRLLAGFAGKKDLQFVPVRLFGPIRPARLTVTLEALKKVPVVLADSNSTLV